MTKGCDNCANQDTQKCCVCSTALKKDGAMSDPTHWKQTENQAIKSDAGKPRISLVPPQIIHDIAEVRQYGVQKYGDKESWRDVDLERYIDALLRHTLAFMADPQSVDAESGIKHYKHMECNLAFISELMEGAK